MAGMIDNPSKEVAEAIVAFLRARAASMGIPEDQIRERLDMSGQPKELAGITVAVEDRGDHPGCVGRILVDVQPSITCWSHLNDDADGSLCANMAGSVMAAMQEVDYHLPDWRVAFPGVWSQTAPTSTEQFRAITLNATLPLVRGSN